MRGGGTGSRNDTSKQLRFMGVVYLEKGSSPEVWLPANSGAYLPEGIYFIAPNPNGAGEQYNFVAGIDSDMRESTSSSTPAYFSVSFPSVGGADDSWFFYEFDERGLSDNPGGLFVIATGEQHSVREFVERVCASLGVQIQWSGEGLDEQATITAVDDPHEIDPVWRVGDVIVGVDKRYYRPAEVETLLGDASQAKADLGWEPRVSFQQLVDEMVLFDLQDAGREKVARDHGFEGAVVQ